MTNTQTGTSTSQVLVTVVANGIICAVFVGTFLLLRLKFVRIYRPKTVLSSIPEDDRPKVLPQDPISWIWVLLCSSNSDLIKYCGLDGYFFLRYLKVMGLCFVGGMFSWTILLPVNAANGKGHRGLDQLSISNVKHPNRYLAHVLVSWVFYGLVMFVINRELYYYNSLTTAAASSPKYATKRSSRTVLFRFVPDEMLDTRQFYKMFDGVKRIFISRNNRKLDSLITKRANMAIALEKAETKLLTMAMKAKKKADKKGETITPVNDIYAYVPQKKRPTIKIGKIFRKKKVDAIDHYLEQLPKLNSEIRSMQKNYNKFRPKNSLIVEFESQYAAQLAYQSVVCHTPQKFIPSAIGFEPSDVIWLNLRMFPFESGVRQLIAWSAMGALIILWAIPVAFVGSISSMDTLMETFTWLSFFKKLPDWLQGVVSGLLPTFLLAILLFMLPIFIRTAAQVSGACTQQQVEDFTQKVYMVQQIINGFLVAALMSSVVAVVKSIFNHPESIMSMLAGQLPLSSNFYIAYLALNAFTIAGGTLLQVVSLVLFYVLGESLDKTARDKWKRYSTLDTMQWGTTLPTHTLLAVITLVYAIISPIILIFGAFTMLMVYIAYSHNLIYCIGQGVDGRGFYYPTTLRQTISGIYLGQICLLGLSAVGKGWAAIVFSIIGIAVTGCWHFHLDQVYTRKECIAVDAMRPLNGVSATPSYKGPTEYLTKVLDRPHTGHAKKEMIEEDERNQQLKSDLCDDMDNQTAKIVPLLADRDFDEEDQYSYFFRFFRFDIFMNFRHAKRDLPSNYYDTPVPEPDNKHAYDSPSASTPCPEIWIPYDPMGLSNAELIKMSKVIRCSNENAVFDEKCRVKVTGSNPVN